MSFPLREAQDAFDIAAEDLAGFLDELTDQDLLASSRCHGWVVADVLAHLHLGLIEMMTGFAHRVEGPPDTDFVTYWARRSAPDPEADIAHTRFVRLLSSAYGRPTGLVKHVRPTLDALRRFVADADDGCVAFQGHTLPIGDFVVTWVVEIVVHHLDTFGSPSDLGPVVRTLDGLTTRQPGWDDLTYVLTGSGRLPGPQGYAVLG